VYYVGGILFFSAERPKNGQKWVFAHTKTPKSSAPSAPRGGGGVALAEKIEKNDLLMELGAHELKHNKYYHPAESQRRAAGLKAEVFPVARAIWLASVEGDAGKAAAALTGQSRVLDRNQTWVQDILTTLYPDSYVDEGDRSRPEGPVPDICPGPEDAGFRRALRKLILKKHWKVPGLSGWTFARIAKIWSCDGDNDCVRLFHVARLVTLLLRGTFITMDFATPM
jgi:hypothetical protein